MHKHPPTKPDEDLNDDEDDVTDEEDPESQESHGWLESWIPPPKESNQKDGSEPSNYQGKKGNMGDSDNSAMAVDGLESSTQELNGIMHDCQRMLKMSDISIHRRGNLLWQ